MLFYIETINSFVTFGDDESKNPETVATSSEYFDYCVMISKIGFPKDFVAKEERAFRERLMKYYDEKGKPGLEVSDVYIYTEEDLEKVIEILGS